MKRQTRLLLIGLCLLVLGSIVLLVLASIVWFLSLSVPLIWAKPGTAIDYNQKLIDLAETRWDSAEPNRWDELVDAFGMLHEIRSSIEEDDPYAGNHYRGGRVEFGLIHTDDREVFRLDGDWPTDEEGRDRVRRSIALTLAFMDAPETREWFATLADLASGGRYVRPKGSGPIVTQLAQDLGQLRALARMNRARLQLALINEDENEFVRLADETLFFAEIALRQPGMIDYLVGVAIRALVIGAIQDALVRGVDDDTCDKLLAVLARHESDSDFVSALAADEILALDFIQATFTDDGNGNGRPLQTERDVLTGNPRPPGFINVLGAFFGASKKQANIQIALQHENLRKQIGADANERGRLRSEQFSQIDTLDGKMEYVTPTYKVHLSTVDIEAARQTEEAAAVVVLHIARFGHAHKRPPDSLDELEAWLDQPLPTDGFATDGRFGYRLLPDPDVFGRRYLLYSVGYDSVDNGGVEGGYSHIAMTADGAGFDRVFNHRNARDTIEPPE